MENQEEVYREAGRALQQITGVDQKRDSVMGHRDTYEELLEHIMATLTKWWASDPEQIPRLLYRIDVDEGMARKAFESDTPVPSLARLILARLEQTAASRITYRNRHSGQS